MSLWGALTGGANIVIHAAGWLEGGLSASYEKFILDVEQLQHVAELMQPVRWNAGELALEALREVGSGGHFFGAAHTYGTLPDGVLHPLGLGLVEFRPVGGSRRTEEGGADPVS